MSKKTVKQILLDAAALIEGPGKWTQGTSARNEAGREVDDHSKSAACFCVVGAIWRSAGGESAGLTAIDTARKLLPEPGFLASWNDKHGRTQAEVVALLRKAAESVS